MTSFCGLQRRGRPSSCPVGDYPPAVATADTGTAAATNCPISGVLRPRGPPPPSRAGDYPPAGPPADTGTAAATNCPRQDWHAMQITECPPTPLVLPGGETVHIATWR